MTCMSNRSYYFSLSAVIIEFVALSVNSKYSRPKTLIRIRIKSQSTVTSVYH